MADGQSSFPCRIRPTLRLYMVTKVIYRLKGVIDGVNQGKEKAGIQLDTLPNGQVFS